MFRLLLVSFLVVLCARQQGLNMTNKVNIERDEDVKKAPSMTHRVNPIQMEKIKKIEELKKENSTVNEVEVKKEEKVNKVNVTENAKKIEEKKKGEEIIKSEERKENSHYVEMKEQEKPINDIKVANDTNITDTIKNETTSNNTVEEMANTKPQKEDIVLTESPKENNYTELPEEANIPESNAEEKIPEPPKEEKEPELNKNESNEFKEIITDEHTDSNFKPIEDTKLPPKESIPIDEPYVNPSIPEEDPLTPSGSFIELYLLKFHKDLLKYVPYPYDLVICILLGYFFISLFSCMSGSSIQLKKAKITTDQNVFIIDKKLKELIVNTTKKVNTKSQPKKSKLTVNTEQLINSIDFSHFDTVDSKLRSLEHSITERTLPDSEEDKKLSDIVDLQISIMDKIDSLKNK